MRGREDNRKGGGEEEEHWEIDRRGRGLKEERKKGGWRKTSDAGSQYRCGWVGRGIQPPFIVQTLYQHSYPKNTFQLVCYGPSDQRTDKASHRVACPQLKRKSGG